MTYLLLGIVCSAALALILKGRERPGINRKALLGVNYVVCVALSLLVMIIGGWELPAFNLGEAWGEVREIFSANGEQLSLAEEKLSPAGSLLWSMLVGGFGGVLFFFGFLLYQIGIHRHGVSLAGAFIKLGIIVPMSLSLVIWREYPGNWQWVGIGLALLAIALVFWPTGSDWRKALKPVLLLLFLVGGGADFMSKLFQQYGLPEYRSHFFLFIFSSALFFSALAVWLSKQAVSWDDALTGLLIGVPNYFSLFFLVLALEQFSAVVVYAAFGAGTILLINLGGVVLFKEKLSRKEWAAMASTALALVLINLQSTEDNSSSTENNPPSAQLAAIDPQDAAPRASQKAPL